MFLDHEPKAVRWLDAARSARLKRLFKIALESIDGKRVSHLSLLQFSGRKP